MALRLPLQLPGRFIHGISLSEIARLRPVTTNHCYQQQPRLPGSLPCVQARLHGRLWGCAARTAPARRLLQACGCGMGTICALLCAHGNQPDTRSQCAYRLPAKAAASPGHHHHHLYAPVLPSWPLPRHAGGAGPSASLPLGRPCPAAAACAQRPPVRTIRPAGE